MDELDNLLCDKMAVLESSGHQIWPLFTILKTSLLSKNFTLWSTFKQKLRWLLYGHLWKNSGKFLFQHLVTLQKCKKV